MLRARAPNDVLLGSRRRTQTIDDAIDVREKARRQRPNLNGEGLRRCYAPRFPVSSFGARPNRQRDACNAWAGCGAKSRPEPGRLRTNPDETADRAREARSA